MSALLSSKKWIRHSVEILSLLFCTTTHSLDEKTHAIDRANKELSIANSHFMIGNISQARDVYQSLLDQYPHSIALLLNTARAAYELNDNTYALQLLTQAYSLQPHNIEVQFQRALCLLSAGDYARGFTAYESRWQRSDKQHISLPCPRWYGESLEHKHILVVGEGDFGDIFQYIRFAKAIKTPTTSITLVVKPILAPLMQMQPYIDNTTSSLTSHQLYDYWISLMSIPAVLECTQDTIPQEMPYLHVSQETKVRNARYVNQTTYNIGICWSADIANDANRHPLAQRSIPLDLLCDACTISGVKLYPLYQKSYSETFDITHGSFVDTAGLIDNLDMVVTVDTAVAHLAGALGKSVWILLPYKSDWRWMLAREDSPWYPTATLIRNHATTDWHELCHNIKTMLIQHLREKCT